MRGNHYRVSLVQAVEGTGPRHGYLRCGTSKLGRWSHREFESEFQVHTHQEYGARRFALRVGRGAQELAARATPAARADRSGPPGPYGRFAGSTRKRLRPLIRYVSK